MRFNFTPKNFQPPLVLGSNPEQKFQKAFDFFGGILQNTCIFKYGSDIVKDLDVVGEFWGVTRENSVNLVDSLKAINFEQHTDLA